MTPPPPSPSLPPDTSIVLATCSRAPLLRGALESLLAQDWIAGHAVEFILVDDGSADETAALLRDFQQRARAERGVSVTLLRGERAGIAAARNLGFLAARGQWLASFDDDQIASPGWLRALRERAEKSGAMCVGGTLALLLPAGVDRSRFGPRARGVLGEHGFGEVGFGDSGLGELGFGEPDFRKPGSGDRETEAPKLDGRELQAAELGPCARQYRGGNDLPATNNALLRRDVFAAAGPFDTRFTEGGEDKDLFRRVRAAGHALWCEPAAQAGHITPAARLTPANLRWTSLRLGASDTRVRLAAAGVLGAVRLAGLRCGVLLLRDAPALLWSSLRRRVRDQLEARCSLWYTEGVLRALPELLSPEHSRQTFLRSLDFRERNGERAERTVVPVKL